MIRQIQYLGHSTVILETDQGTRILIDPWITENYACPLGLDDLGAIDLILVTHGAEDHLGDTLPIAQRTGATVMCGSDVRAHLLAHGIPEEQIQVMIWGATRQFRDVTVRCLESRHHSFFRSGDKYLSNIAMSYIVSAASGPSVYHMGDTSIFSDLKLFAELYKPSVILVPIGQQRGMLTELDPKEAAIVMSWMKPRIAIPIHYDPVTQRDEPAKFVEEAARLAPEVQVKVLTGGEILQLDGGE